MTVDTLSVKSEKEHLKVLSPAAACLESGIVLLLGLHSHCGDALAVELEGQRPLRARGVQLHA